MEDRYSAASPVTGTRRSRIAHFWVIASPVYTSENTRLFSFLSGDVLKGLISYRSLHPLLSLQAWPSAYTGMATFSVIGQGGTLSLSFLFNRRCRPLPPFPPKLRKEFSD